MRKELEEWRLARAQKGHQQNQQNQSQSDKLPRGKENRPSNGDGSRLGTPKAPRATADPRRHSPERVLCDAGAWEKMGAFRTRSPMPAPRSARASRERLGPPLPQSFQCPKKSELRSRNALALLTLGAASSPSAPPNSPRSATALLGRPVGVGAALPPAALLAALRVAFQAAPAEPVLEPVEPVLVPEALPAPAMPSVEEEERQLRQEEEELHQQHLELLDRLGRLQAEAMTSERDEEVLRGRFAEVTGELQELSLRQQSQEQRAWKHRVRRHRSSWPVRTALEMEDHLSRAHDIFNFWFFEMRDRLNSTLRGFRPMENALQAILEDRPMDTALPTERIAAQPERIVHRGVRYEKFVWICIDLSKLADVLLQPLNWQYQMVQS
eukprot:s1172_g8.t1